MVNGVRRALTATATVAVLLCTPVLVGCSGGSTSADPKADPTGGSGSGTTAAPTVEQDHTVPSPGPRGPGVVAPADFLVTLPDTADKDLVTAVEHVAGVSSVTVISLSEAVIENEAVTVAAVDPATYRTFVVGQADNQVPWDRVAGGELALKPRLQKKLPIDAEDYLRLGGAKDATTVHVGAYVEQQPLIDAVVNETWVDTLGMKRDNAMLIRTGSRAPGKVRAALEKVLGPDAAVTPVDKASRIGLDPNAPQVAVVTGSVADAVGVFKYTVLPGGHIAPDPGWVRDHIATEVVPILGAVTCNKVIFRQLRAALEEIHERGLDDKIHPGEYAGCYYPRFIAGTTTLSNHAFGLALDLNVPGNQRGTVGEMDRDVVSIFQNWGFTWGGDWHYTDPMHFELNSIVTPQSESSRTE